MDVGSRSQEEAMGRKRCKEATAWAIQSATAGQPRLTMSIFHRWLLKRQSRSVRRHFSAVMRPTSSHLSTSTSTRYTWPAGEEGSGAEGKGGQLEAAAAGMQQQTQAELGLRAKHQRHKQTHPAVCSSGRTCQEERGGEDGDGDDLADVDVGAAGGGDDAGGHACRAEGEEEGERDGRVCEWDVGESLGGVSCHASGTLCAN